MSELEREAGRRGEVKNRGMREDKAQEVVERSGENNGDLRTCGEDSQQSKLWPRNHEASSFNSHISHYIYFVGQ